MLGFTLDTWNNLMLAALALGGLAAVLIAVTTLCVVRLQKQESADQMERIEQLRNANLKLEARIAPRQLSTDDLTNLTAISGKFNDRPISVWSYGLDIEAGMLASQIIKALDVPRRVPVIDRTGAMISSTTPRIGVRLTGPDDELIEALINGLKPLSPVRDPYTPQPGQIVPAAEIFVGIKPITQ